MCNCSCHSEINRDGSGQLTRYLKALDPQYAPIDERNPEELLVFARRYAEQIRFYDIPASKIADPTDPAKISWKEFFRRDMAVIAASIGVVDTAQWKTNYDLIRSNLDIAPTPDLFISLFPPVLTILTQIDHWYSIAIPENPLRQDLSLGIASSLKDSVKKMIAFEMGYKALYNSPALNLDFSSVENPDIWGINDPVVTDTSIFEGPHDADKFRNAALYMDDVFLSFYGFITQLVGSSDNYLQFALERYPAHQPHMALFITFLQLFQVARDQFNGLTGKMLDYYYREVLQLPEKPSIPDKAYIVFELAKDVTAYDLPLGTALKAGKDDTGIDQIYATENDFVINQAKVKEMKNFFLEKSSVTLTGLNNATKVVNKLVGYYARPVAKSQDGFGAPITDPSGKWVTFGKGNPLDNPSKNPCDLVDQVKEELGRIDRSQIGFAIASPQLLLQGGKRIIRMRIAGLSRALTDVSASGQLSTVKSPFHIYLSGQKGWLGISRLMPQDEYDGLTQYLPAGIINPDAVNSNGDTNIATGYYMEDDHETVFIYLGPNEQPIVNYDPKLHKGADYKTLYPVMQVLLTPQVALQEDVLTNMQVSQLSLEVQVGSIFPSGTQLNTPVIGALNIPQELLSNPLYDGLHQLVLQNDDGAIPADKPFDPYTAYPDDGKSLYIGSSEVFNKPLGQLAVQVRRNYDKRFVFKVNSSLEHKAVPGKKAAQDKTAQDKNAGLEKKAVLTPHAFIPPSTIEVAVRTNSDWVELSTDTGGSIYPADLPDNILFVRDISNATTRSAAFPLVRKPVEDVTAWNNQVDKGFLRITFARENADTHPITMQDSQAIAPKLKVKEIALSYHSVLPVLEGGIDQFFHIYPFGVTETFLSGLETGVYSPGRFLNKPAKGYTYLDNQRAGLLVDAGNRLFPQFTYASPYSVLDKAPAPPKPVYQIQAGQGNEFFHSDKKLTGISNALDLVAQRLPAAEARFDYPQVVSMGAGLKDRQNSLNQYSGVLQEEGLLFIGLEKAVPLQTLSLLFQFAEGSAADEDDDPPPVHWSYLSFNQWKPLKGENLISDGTVGFQATGIIRIEVPEDANDKHTILTNGLTWFCASVTENADRIPELIDIVAQAAEVVFQDKGNSSTHFDSSLPAGSIGKLATAVDQVSKVQQPFSSFDGKHRETPKEYYTRVSERLRHKGRAINAWDYEHLVLDRFPGIYKVKCIPHTDPNCLCRHSKVTTTHPDNITGRRDIGGNLSVDRAEVLLANAFRRLVYTQDQPSGGQSGHTVASTCCGPQVAPGHVLLIPVAFLKNRNAVNPLKPKTSRRTLLDIQAFLQQRVSPFVHVHAKNPVYEEIIVAFRVKFYLGYDIGYYLKQLNTDIVQYLTPWAFDETADLVFGQKVYASSIINFIEKRPYVDFITDFFMAVCKDECCPKHDHGKEPAPPAQGGTTGGPGNTGTGAGGTTAGPVSDTGGVAGHFSDDLAMAIKKACNCEEVFYLVAGQTKFRGEIVAVPSGPRSILVSVPQHIIVPYEAPDSMSPCDRRKLNGVAQPPAPVPPGNPDPDRPVPGQPVPVKTSPTQPAPSQPAPAQPAPAPAPAQPAPARPGGFQPVQPIHLAQEPFHPAQPAPAAVPGQATAVTATGHPDPVPVKPAAELAKDHPVKQAATKKASVKPAPVKKAPPVHPKPPKGDA
ncbi:hypothetical protein ACX0G9_00065 [Flavitalea flava]